MAGSVAERGEELAAEASSLTSGKATDDGISAPIDWEAVRADYEGGEGTLRIIADRYGISLSQLSWRARHDVWRMRNARMGSSGPTLLARLFRLLERQIFELEKVAEPMGEKEVATLNRVAGTLEKLIDIERRDGGKKQPKRQSKDLEYLRNKVARRLEELGRG